MKMQKKSLLFLFTALFLTSFNAMANCSCTCAAQVQTKLTAAPYDTLDAILTLTKVNSIKNKLAAVTNHLTYNLLLTEANLTAALLNNGRVVITLFDGTVVVDTAKGTLNTYDNFIAKAINENHNTNIAILHAQLYVCGIGLETRIRAKGVVEVHLAKRLGAYLNSIGTISISYH